MALYFLIVTLSLASPVGGEPGAQTVGIFESASECETAMYSIKDYTTEFEQKNGAVASLHCIQHYTEKGVSM